jgi:hypothetical protein
MMHEMNNDEGWELLPFADFGPGSVTGIIDRQAANSINELMLRILKRNGEAHLYKFEVRENDDKFDLLVYRRTA